MINNASISRTYDVVLTGDSRNADGSLLTGC